MNNYDFNKDLPLNKDELLMKEIFLHITEQVIETEMPDHIKSLMPKEYYDFFVHDSNWIAFASPEAYLEEAYIPVGYDVSVSRHDRYSPSKLHYHYFFEILCVVNGSCTNYIASHQLEMQSGDICIIAPKTPHALSAFNDDCIAYNLLIRASTFDKAFFGTLAENDVLASFFSKTLYGTDIPEAYILFHTLGDTEIMNYIALAYEEFEGTQIYKKRMLNSILTMFFITLLRNHEKDTIIPHPEGKTPDNKIIAILNYIQSNYKTVTMSELSVLFNYSERHLTRLLKEYTGYTFMNIVQTIKIRRATDLLANPDLSLQDIIELTGYTDISHFYKVFRKYYNMTPIQFKETVQKDYHN